MNLRAIARKAIEKLRRRPTQPPFAGVREPRRPKPTLPSGAIALAEPRTSTRTRIRLFNRRDTARG
ncbi:MAG: hypothetical protein ABSA93_27195 [Streptosporangiaceae bacterium]|jgi:hypothetical protein